MADRQQQWLALEKEAQAAYELLKASSFLLGNTPEKEEIKSTVEMERKRNKGFE